jgi:hypothetical protein
MGKPDNPECRPDAPFPLRFLNTPKLQAECHILRNGGIHDSGFLEDHSHAPADSKPGFLVCCGILSVKEDLS